MSNSESYNKNIFIADDDENFLDLYEDILLSPERGNVFDESQSEFYLKKFKNGKELLDTFKYEYKKGRRIPLCILDMKMPVMDGVKTAAGLRKIDSSVVIIIVTAYSQVSFSSIRENLKKDIYYVNKPFHKEELYCLADSLVKVWNKSRNLQENKKRLKLALEGANEGFWDMRLLERDFYLSPCCYTLFGYEPYEFGFDYKNFENLIHPDDLYFVRNSVNDCLKNKKKSFEIEFRLEEKSGTLYWVLLKGKVVDVNENNEPVRFSGTITDITKRKNAELELRKSESLFRATLENISDAVFLTDDRGDFVFVCPNSHVIFGYSRKEVEVMGNINILMDKPLCDMGDLEEAGEILNVEHMIINKSGRKCFLFINIKKVDIAGGTVLYTCRDVTKIKEAEENLKESQQFSFNILNSAPIPILVINPDTSIKYANPSLEKLTGFSAFSISGCTTPYPWWQRGKNKPDSKDKKFSDCEKKFEKFFKKKNGEYFWVEISSIPVMDKGRVLYYLESWLDITERKKAEERLSRAKGELEIKVKDRTKELEGEIFERCQAEEALRKSEQKFRYLSKEYNSFLQAIPDILMVISADLKILWANKVALSFFNIGELLNRNCYEVICKNPAPCDICSVLKCFSSGKTETEKLVVDNNRHLDMKLNPIKDDRGEVREVILVASDITEKVIFQQEAIRTSHLASIGKLAAGVAHEINNPINSIINYGQIIKDVTLDGREENNLAGEIIIEGNRVASIVKSLLSFSRGGKGEKYPVSVVEIMKSTFSLIETGFIKDGIKIETHFINPFPSILAHPVQIQQVLLNILSNSRYALNKKYSDCYDKKIMKISGKEIEADSTSYICLSFLDNGSGIAEDILGRVLEPFFSGKPPGQGTGLGLSISYGIINDHGGKISIESKEGEFTEVKILLPIFIEK